MGKRVGMYLRVSTADQTTDNQRRVLDEAAEHHGWQVANIYEDAAISGSKGRDKRPAFDRLLKDVTRGKIDIVMAWSVDRLGRSLQDLCAFLGELHAAGADLYLDQQGIDTSTPAGRAMFQMMGVFAEFERAIIIERVRAGQDRARAQGVKFGRPTLPDATEHAIRRHLANGVGINKTARLVGCGVSAVQRIKLAA